MCACIAVYTVDANVIEQRSSISSSEKQNLSGPQCPQDDYFESDEKKHPDPVLSKCVLGPLVNPVVALNVEARVRLSESINSFCDNFTRHKADLRKSFFIRFRIQLVSIADRHHENTTRSPLDLAEKTNLELHHLLTLDMLSPSNPPWVNGRATEKTNLKAPLVCF